MHCRSNFHGGDSLPEKVGTDERLVIVDAIVYNVCYVPASRFTESDVSLFMPSAPPTDHETLLMLL